MTSTQQREPERVNLLADSDSEDEYKPQQERSSHFWPRDLANSAHAEAGIVDNEGKIPGCVASANRMIRIAFLRKVLGIVSFQIILTIAICTAIYFIPNSKSFLQRK
ncbi:unnamed protein product [Caenorhabditis angaria]|uniref:Uncharacterized protein n=1 Tax=Caenorhabditis angaria TaxID=860376 RepID=A0A9P1NBQ0_9PELO|nr:unnamed protein product [Caenorhabditis angaria]